MMKFLSSRITWGLVLIAAGILFLLQNLNFIPDNGWIWAIAFGFGGLLFLVYFFSTAERWWAAFPAFGLLGIAGTIVIADLIPGNIPGEWAGAFFMGMLGLSFLFVYVRNREHWWPIIPAGAILTVAGIILVTIPTGNPDPSTVLLVLFGGLALTFLLLTILPSKSGRAGWAIWPGAILLVPAVFAGAGSFGLLNYLLPAVLILAGGFILVRSFR